MQPSQREENGERSFRNNHFRRDLNCEHILGSPGSCTHLGALRCCRELDFNILSCEMGEENEKSSYRPCLQIITDWSSSEPPLPHLNVSCTLIMWDQFSSRGISSDDFFSVLRCRECSTINQACDIFRAFDGLEFA